MIWILLGCIKHGDFGVDESTNLSGLVDEQSIHPSCLDDSGLIVETPNDSAFAVYRRKGFIRYTQVVAPNGGIIPIFAQDKISDEQLIRARNILRFFLTNAPDTTLGTDKSAVANSMADNGAVLMMPNGEHREGREPNLDAQPLYESETQVEGHDWFMTNNYNHRDAAFEEIFHLVHDAGIGTYMQGALPDYQTDLLSEANSAIEDGRWGIAVEESVDDWLEDLRREDSLAQEYIVSVLESYYGFWSAWDGGGGMWGIYIAGDRDEVHQLDPRGQQLIEDFLPPMIHTEFRMHPELDQDFYMSLNPDLVYTHRSQYYLFMTLTGTNDVGLFGNDESNTLRGNVGNNVLDGVGGENTAIYCHPREDYNISIEQESQSRHVISLHGPEGEDTLLNIDWIHFADGKMNVDSIIDQ